MKKIIGTMTATAILTTLLTSQVSAENTEEQPELKEDVITYGGNLTSEQKDDVREKLGAKESYKSYDVSVGDVEKFTGVTYDHIYSSSVIEPKSFGKGVDVEIVTPDNITKVTEEQYTNAAISAGIQNAKIRVASTVEPTTGDGALTGIVKAYAEAGNDLNAEDVKNANQEMSDLANISEENKGNDDYSDAAMNNAVADMKEQVADEKEQNGDVSEDKIRSIVDETLKEKGLDNAINDNQRNTIYNIIINVANSNTLQNDPKAFKKQIGDYKNQLEKNHGDLIDKVKDKAKDLNTEENRNFLQKIWDAIVGFIQWLIDLIGRLF
ncbi:DUF1002 domain-containing protein [Staphylococcus aureus]|uniref:DUF1002 domain-containing protein n=1 Tax=Staphylococcus aureus TaxID=1280 RepID=UPI00044E9947|nr:DUF1002 domain-containing protein [Staphylococcus aureus]EZX75053.1 hypothetical protein V110_02643 [Staphylococcus aureus Chi-8]HDE8373974.1 DUF1002 domain-containing protein [Staphylococcus aureus]HDG4884461.1 DUF1002 domain-containing protein [Staphylococcus aureus]HDK3864933.1 DUF1002 domain-containing protein [Staphylococcus aureus]HEO8862705.1 DUF1002 domain-containing protein [Staphylococcus aureus]